MINGLILCFIFLTGIPGGLDYLCLTLVKNNKMNI